MRFNKLVVLGNPPYNTGGTKGMGDKRVQVGVSVYGKFIEGIIDNMMPDYLSMVIPSRWLQQGGKVLTSFRTRMVNDRRLRIVEDGISGAKTFPSAFIVGGVCYFLWDKKYNGECTFNGIQRRLNDFDIVVREHDALPILGKVKNNTSRFLDVVVSTRKPYGISNLTPTAQNGVVCMFRHSMGKKFVDGSIVKNLRGDINKWKVIIPFAIPEKWMDLYKPTRLLSKTSHVMSPPGEICSETFLVVNSFDTEIEAINFVSYMKTKFFRYMLRLRVISQYIPRGCFAWVPDVIDYSVPWTDKDLYAKYDLSLQEIAIIESKIL
jgi:site-specific DNA-methyltransferase (adenine-specific)